MWKPHLAVSVWFHHRDRLCVYVKGPRICEGLLLTFKTWLVTCVVWCLQTSSRWYFRIFCLLQNFLGGNQLASLKLTSPLKMMVSNRNLLFQGSIFRGYVSFREGIISWILLHISQMLTPEFFTRESTFFMGPNGKIRKFPSFPASDPKDRDVDLEGTYVIWLKKNESL